MTRTLTALYDTRADAERARDRLIELGIPPASINLVDQSAAALEPGAAAQPPGTTVPPTGAPPPPRMAIPPADTTVRPLGADTRSAAPDTSSPKVTAPTPVPGERPGFWARLRHMFPERERRTYEEGVHRGGTLLTAAVDDAVCERSIAVLEESHPVDLQQRQEEWRKAGWTPDYAAATEEAPVAGAAPAPAARTGDGGERVIPVADEDLRVGKREISRGSVRVHSYVVEEPVQENVRLREDHVEVERRPARNTSPAGASDALKEHTVEMRETAEEPVVEKEPRVKEEVVVRKRAGEHVEQVKDTVRRTRVDVERSPGAGPGKPAEVERAPRRPEDRPGH